MTAAFGLTEKEIAAIVAVLRRHAEVEEAYIFGSRAQGTYKPGSDVDIALGGENVTHETVVGISMELNEETLMPYRFDILCLREIGNPDLRESIKRTAVEFYRSAVAAH